MADVNVVDRSIGKPPSFNGDKKKRKEWSTKTKAFAGAVDPETRRALTLAEQRNDPIPLDGMGDSERILNEKLHFILTGLVEGPAFTKLQGCSEGNGEEVWRALAKNHRPRTAGHQRARLGKTTSPAVPEDKKTYSERKDRWGQEVRTSIQVGGEPSFEAIKMAVTSGVLALKEMRAHLTMNAARLNTADLTEREAEQYIEATEGQREAAGDHGNAMDVNAVRKGGGQGGGKGKGNQQHQGWTWWGNTAGKHHPPAQQGGGKGAGKGKDKGKNKQPGQAQNAPILASKATALGVASTVIGGNTAGGGFRRGRRSRRRRKRRLRLRRGVRRRLNRSRNQAVEETARMTAWTSTRRLTNWIHHEKRRKKQQTRKKKTLTGCFIAKDTRRYRRAIGMRPVHHT